MYNNVIALILYKIMQKRLICLSNTVFVILKFTSSPAAGTGRQFLVSKLKPSITQRKVFNNIVLNIK